MPLPSTDIHPRRRALVVAPPPTPNGDLHLGHLSGPYLRADIYARALRMDGVDTLYITGIDDHQSYVAMKGERIGASPAETADLFGQTITRTLAAARIEPDLIGFPRASPHHITLARTFLHRLHADGKLVLRDAPALFCETCDEFLFEAFVSGGCPHCGTPTGGNACEVCGRPNDCADLVAPQCNRCQAAPSVRSYPRLYFPLARHEERLREYWSTVQMGPHLKSLIDRMLAAGLPDVAVTHFSRWGIPADLPGLEGQRIYVWFEMAAGHVAATRDVCEAQGRVDGWEAFWKSPDTEIVEFMGFDNGYFYSVLFPAIYFAFDGGMRAPSAFITNEFYRLEGLKFSTSRGHAVWGTEFLARIPADPVRFYLAYSGPETEQTDFTFAEFAASVRSELVRAWQGWLAELAVRIGSDAEGRAPAAEPRSREQQAFIDEIREVAGSALAAYTAEAFSPQAVARALAELVRRTRRFAASQEHWRGIDARREERRAGIALELAAAQTLALLVAPLMPGFASALWRDLGNPGRIEDQRWESLPALVPAGQPVALRGEYFEEPVDAAPAPG
ncbi:MAG TPA: class I tRNA ligase family protein [Longimicrobium sp.]|jgi:methionyl-tRNA synthetase|uniref:methionine--tRNA ligase n=1 Tax=Longimicrobium sp. TaxID=2029185 RepID=UPI002EDB98CB